MKKAVFFILVLIFACTEKGQKIEIAPDIDISNRYDIYSKIFEERLKYIAIYPENPSLKDTINILKRYVCNLNPDCQVFIYNNNKPTGYFGVCGSEIKSDGILIYLRPIDKGAYNRGILSSEIKIEIKDDKYDIVYYKNYLKKAYSDSVVTDTIEIQRKHLKLSSNKLIKEEEVLGELTLITTNDSIHGQFRYRLKENRNKKDTSNIQFEKIGKDEIHDFLNKVYIPNCIDTSEAKKIFEYTRNRINFSNKSHIYLYLKNIEKLSHDELNFLQEQNESYQEAQKKSYFDTTWIWKQDKLNNVRIGKNEDYEKIDASKNITHKDFYDNGLVILSKPLISNNREIMIIYEQFETNPMCMTGKIRTYVFKKINNKWAITNLIYM